MTIHLCIRDIRKTTRTESASESAFAKQDRVNLSTPGFNTSLSKVRQVPNNLLQINPSYHLRIPPYRLHQHPKHKVSFCVGENYVKQKTHPSNCKEGMPNSSRPMKPPSARDRFKLTEGKKRNSPTPGTKTQEVGKNSLYQEQKPFQLERNVFFWSATPKRSAFLMSFYLLKTDTVSCIPCKNTTNVFPYMT